MFENTEKLKRFTSKPTTDTECLFDLATLRSINVTNMVIFQKSFGIYCITDKRTGTMKRN